MRRKLEDKNIRKIYKNGGSYALTLPIEVADKLNLRKGQKVVVDARGKTITIKDWKE